MLRQEPGQWLQSTSHVALRSAFFRCRTLPGSWGPSLGTHNYYGVRQYGGGVLNDDYMTFHLDSNRCVDPQCMATSTPMCQIL